VPLYRFVTVPINLLSRIFLNMVRKHRTRNIKRGIHFT